MALFDKLKQAAMTATDKINEFTEENQLNEKLTELTDSLQKTWDENIAPSQPSATEQIEKLAKMRDEGILTEEEFQAKKEELLKKI